MSRNVQLPNPDLRGPQHSCERGLCLSLFGDIANDAKADVASVPPNRPDRHFDVDERAVALAMRCGIKGVCTGWKIAQLVDKLLFGADAVSGTTSALSARVSSVPSEDTVTTKRYRPAPMVVGGMRSTN